MAKVDSDLKQYALVFGLSANPVHQGHIDLLIGTLLNLKSMGYDVVQTLIVPVYRRNPVGSQKYGLPESFEQRIVMCELAAQEIQTVVPGIDISVNRVEAQLAMQSGTPNYTAETLTYLKAHVVTDLELIFVISSELVSGEDPEFSHWYQTNTILKASWLAVCPRPGFCLNQDYIKSLTANGGRFIVLDNVKTPDVSSTVVRNRLQKGENPLILAKQGLIPLAIAQYLNKNNPYLNCKTASKGHFHP